MMQAIDTAISDVKIIVPTVYTDARGYFLESFRADQIAELVGKKYQFVQDNHSHSVKNVLRGLHYQIKNPQGKLVRVLKGEIYDVSVDMRQGSANFGRWVGCILTAESQKMIWVPPHFAHGFLVLSEQADVLYKTTDYYSPAHERCLRWDDPDLAIGWPLTAPPILSAKDERGCFFRGADFFK